MRLPKAAQLVSGRARIQSQAWPTPQVFKTWVHRQDVTTRETLDVGSGRVLELVTPGAGTGSGLF